MAFQGSLEDRLLIRERYGSYSDASSRGDVDAWLANWSEDCVWAVFGMELKGKPALRAQWDTIWETIETLAFFAEVGAIEVNGDRAAGRSYCREIFRSKDGGIRKLVGQYTDDLVRQDGIWVFARRAYVILIDEPGANA